MGPLKLTCSYWKSDIRGYDHRDERLHARIAGAITKQVEFYLRTEDNDKLLIAADVV